MGSMFRSEEMALAQFFIQPEAAYYITSELGEAGCVQFKDLNGETSLFQREFANEIKRSDQMERQINYLELEIKKFDVPIPDIIDVPKAPKAKEISQLEVHLKKTEREVRELSQGVIVLRQKYTKLLQTKYVLEKANHFLVHQEEIFTGLTEEEKKNASQLGIIAGVINKEKLFSFERMMFRVGKGNIYVRQEDIADIENPETGLPEKKCVFMVFFQGENLYDKVKKICNAYRTVLIDCPDNVAERNAKIIDVSVEIEDVTKVLEQSNSFVRRTLVAVARDLQNWNIMVRKMKAIFNTMNYFSMDITRKCLIGEGWIPVNDIRQVQEILHLASVNNESLVGSFMNILVTKEVPPTYNRTNKFTRGFQNLISAYGFANYQELNPALYTIITFPFLFAVMFGDLGHACIMLLVGCWLVFSEKKVEKEKNKGEIFMIFFNGRYIILLMGMFSLYTGFLYNDLFSKSMNIFGSKWNINSDLLPDNSTNDDSDYDLLPRINYEGYPYIFGMDPIWQSAKNKIIFLNSFKMKMSIVFGVIHMLFGVILSTINHIHYKKYSALFLDFLPKIFFLTFLFFYLTIMIILKWVLYSGTYDGVDENDFSPGVDHIHGSACAPSVLIYFIGMMLFKTTEAAKDCEAYMFDGQQSLQQGLLFASVLCIPVLLFGTPIYNIIKRKKRKAGSHQHIPNNQDRYNSMEAIIEVDQYDLEEEEEEPMSEILVHQAIETIEYTLSTVSHTASYLRLWALSLAHSQLSEVTWTMIFQKGLTMNFGWAGGVLIYLTFIPWAACTISVLVLMEGLSAFLHTLRLHWVEFMSKFYKGEGYEFIPFSFKAIFAEDGE